MKSGVLQKKTDSYFMKYNMVDVMLEQYGGKPIRQELS